MRVCLLASRVFCDGDRLLAQTRVVVFVCVSASPSQSCCHELPKDSLPQQYNPQMIDFGLKNGTLCVLPSPSPVPPPHPWCA